MSLVKTDTFAAEDTRDKENPTRSMTRRLCECIIARLDAQNVRGKHTRSSIGLEMLVGAAMVLRVTGDETQAAYLRELCMIVASRGEDFLKELAR